MTSQNFKQPEPKSIFSAKNQSENIARVKEELKVEEISELTNETPIPFKGTTTTRVMKSRDLETLVNQAFGVYGDYYGCKIVAEANGPRMIPALELYFKPTTPDGDTMMAFVSTEASVGKGTSLEDKLILASIPRDRNDHFALTNEGAQGLYKFLTKQIRDKVDPRVPATYKQILTEIPETAANGRQIAVMQVRGLDINEVLRFIHGDKDKEDGSKIFYNIIIDRALAADQMGQPVGWLLSISKLTEASYKQFLEDAGVQINYGRLNITTVNSVD